ncbi:MAG: DnaJ domain-containing protein [Myxococcota bacterium]
MATPDVDAARKLLEQRFEAVRKTDYFGVLGVRREASPSKVQEAYFDLVKRFHPDKIATAGLEDMRDQAMAVFQFATEAKDVLSDRTKRGQYIRGELKPEAPGGVDEKGGRKARNAGEVGKISFHKGSVLLDKRAYTDAEKFLRQAVSAVPDEARYWSRLGWAIFQNAEARPEPQRLEEARKAWEKAMELDEESAEVHYFMSLYHKARDEGPDQRKELNRALHLDPSHVDAKREKRLLRMRAEKRRKERGLVSKLLDKLRR